MHQHHLVIAITSTLLFGCGPLSSKKQDKPAKASAGEQCEADGCPTSTAAPLRRTGHDGKAVTPLPRAGHDAKDSPAQSPFQGTLPTLTIDDVELSGNGCAPDTTAVNVSNDAKAFTVLFADFVIELGPDAPAGKNGVARAARACRIALTLDVPHGYRVAVMTMDFRGFADLEDGADGELRSGVAFGQSQPKTFSHQMTGPYAEDLAIRDELTLRAASYSACGGQTVLNIDVQASITSQGGATGLIALDSADGELTQTYGLAWRRCPTQ